MMIKAQLNLEQQILVLVFQGDFGQLLTDFYF